MSPLFIPLKREHFEAFERGDKTFEFRQYGPRWNERTCTVGRPVILSLGYGKQRRLKGKVVSFRKVLVTQSRCSVAQFMSLFKKKAAFIAEIKIEVVERGEG